MVHFAFRNVGATRFKNEVELCYNFYPKYATCKVIVNIHNIMYGLLNHVVYVMSFNYARSAGTNIYRTMSRKKNKASDHA